jgi:phosphoesterase RecJ-like protein
VEPASAAGTVAAAAAAVASAPRDGVVLLSCHINPDGDALGSMLGFGLGLRQLGFRNVRASFPEPFEVVEPFRFLPGQELLVAPGSAPTDPDLAISFDAASPNRLGPLASISAASPIWLVLDHHVSNAGFGSVRLIEPGAAATGVVAARLLDELGVAYDCDIATCLYVALATDTGSFRFDTTTQEVLALAGRLVAAGARPAEVSRQVFDTRSFGALRLLAAVLGRAELDPGAAGGRGLVAAYATASDLVEYDQPLHVLESFVDVVRTTAEADVACLLKPIRPGEWGVSLRSKGATDVSVVALALGGGGHRLAAGFTGNGSAAEILAAVRTALETAPRLWPVPRKDQG